MPPKRKNTASNVAAKKKKKPKDTGDVFDFTLNDDDDVVSHYLVKKKPRKSPLKGATKDKKNKDASSAATFTPPPRRRRKASRVKKEPKEDAGSPGKGAVGEEKKEPEEEQPMVVGMNNKGKPDTLTTPGESLLKKDHVPQSSSKKLRWQDQLDGNEQNASATAAAEAATTKETVLTPVSSPQTVVTPKKVAPQPSPPASRNPVKIKKEPQSATSTSDPWMPRRRKRSWVSGKKLVVEMKEELPSSSSSEEEEGEESAEVKSPQILVPASNEPVNSVEPSSATKTITAPESAAQFTNNKASDLTQPTLLVGHDVNLVVAPPLPANDSYEVPPTSPGEKRKKTDNGTSRETDATPSNVNADTSSMSRKGTAATSDDQPSREDRQQEGKLTIGSGQSGDNKADGHNAGATEETAIKPMDEEESSKDLVANQSAGNDSPRGSAVVPAGGDSRGTKNDSAAHAHPYNDEEESQPTRKRNLDEGYLLYLKHHASRSSPPSQRTKKPVTPSTPSYIRDNINSNSVFNGASDDESDNGGGKIGAVRDLQRRFIVDVEADQVPSSHVETTSSAPMASSSSATKNNPVVVELLDSSDESEQEATRGVKREGSKAPSVNNVPEHVSSNNDGRSSPMEEEIEWIATANETRLPHMRQHCTDYKFDLNLELSLNRKYCDLCYCYVCDVPVKDCKSWDSSGHQLQNHCNGHDTNSDAPYWKERREAAAKKNNNDPQEVTRGEGPFDPTDGVAQQDPNLTQCRRCKWYNRFFHRNFRYYKNLHPVGFLDWCHKCGRVASEQDFCKIQSQPLKPQAGDLFLGTKEVPFRVFVHDPREMERYEDSWLDAEDDLPEWQYDEGEMREDFFEHRLGERPVLSMILASISIVEDQADITDNTSFAVTYSASSYLRNDAPVEEREYSRKNGCSRFSYWDSPKSEDKTKTSVNETEGIRLTREGDLILFQQLSYFEEEGFCKRVAPTERSEGKKSTLTFGITAKWDPKSMTGTFFVKLFLKPQTGRFKPLSGAASWNKLLGAWFDVFPIPLSDINGALEAKEPAETDDDWYTSCHDEEMPVPPFSLSSEKKKNLVRQILPTIEQSIDDINSSARTYRNNLSLESTQEAKGFGGTSNLEQGFSNSLRRYYSEILVDDITKGRQRSGKWIRRSLGVVSSHRKMRKAGESLPPNTTWRSAERADFHDLSYLKDEERPLALCLRDACDSVFDGTRSTSSIIAHSENLGHPEIRFVNGLNVELLPFQRQSVQWALDRETVEGGIQSWLWPRLPRVVRPRKKPVYYSPILETWRTEKPNLVRGGIIAAEMGLGKTVISLALILANPAPEFPLSGFPAKDLDVMEQEATTWDKDLYARNSTGNPKIGSVISRGTLVVCKVSLVGQWIEEARSKLKDPGLVYPYHGANRKRDPKILSKNAIVVTTYEILKSDAVYHRNKSSDANYVPPLCQVRWWRLICDESHSIAHAGTEKSDALMGLVADHKWLVSGTPIQTSLTDLKNQLKFLGIDNINEMSQLFRNTLEHTNDRAAQQPKKRGRRFLDFGNNARNRGHVQLGHYMFFLRTLFLRHSQQQKYRNAVPKITLMQLPNKTERTVLVEFCDEEQDEYQGYEERALNFYTSFRQRHLKTLSKHFLKLSAKLTQSRIACSGGHVPLLNGDGDKSGEDENDSEDESQTPTKKKGKVVQYSDFAFKSKFNKLIEELEYSRDNDPSSKSLVFSQFASSLQYLQAELPKHGFQYRTLTGDMPMRRRAKALHDFQHDPPTTVFLLSMRAGAVGINLTQANRVFLLEPCFNPALEAQSIGRVYRLGQKREVEVIRLCMEGTVESRMMEMLQQKYGDRDQSDEGEDDHSDNGEAIPDAAKAAKANNTLVGSVNNDKATVLAAEFDLLFGYQADDEITPEAANSSGPGAVPGASEGTEMFFDAEEDVMPDAAFSFPDAGSGRPSKPGTSGFL